MRTLASGAMDDGDGYAPGVVQHRKYGVLKHKKKRVEEAGVVEAERFVPVAQARGHGVLKHKKKQKMVEVGHIDALPVYEPPPVYDPAPVYDLPRSGVLKKRKVTKPPRPNLVLRGNAAWRGVRCWSVAFSFVVEGLLLIHDLVGIYFLVVWSSGRFGDGVGRGWQCARGNCCDSGATCEGAEERAACEGRVEAEIGQSRESASQE